jgi:hypothetical protein
LPVSDSTLLSLHHLPHIFNWAIYTPNVFIKRITRATFYRRLLQARSSQNEEDIKNFLFDRCVYVPSKQFPNGKIAPQALTPIINIMNELTEYLAEVAPRGPKLKNSLTNYKATCELIVSLAKRTCGIDLRTNRILREKLTKTSSSFAS